MANAVESAQNLWNDRPLLLTEQARYAEYPWLYDVAEFREHGGERVLEIGCGTGSDLLQFAKHGAIATGVDITDKHLELAQQRVGDLASIVKADMRSLPFADGSFDYVYSQGVLHHSDTPGKAASEILRVLRPGGRFNIGVYALWSESAFLYFAMHGFQWRRFVENSTAAPNTKTPPIHIDLYTARRFRKLFPGCHVTFSKHRCYHLPFAASLLGWFLVGKGSKPIQATFLK